MTEKAFVTWFKGFVAAANTFNITPKQWDTICEHLEKVKDTEEDNNRVSRYTLDNGSWVTTSAASGRVDVTYGTGKELITETH